MPDQPDVQTAPPSRPVPTWAERIELLTGGGAAARGPWSVAGTAVAGAVLAMVIGYWAIGGGRPEAPELSIPVAGGPGDPSLTSTTTTTLAELVVHAAGAVRLPGVYRMTAGARVADLLDAAGGPAEGADVDRLNLAAALVDGMRVYVPRVGEPVPPELPVASSGTASAPVAGRLVDLNAATREDLEALPGIGPATAQAIIDERERRGRFTSIEELLEVRGIGPAKLDAIRDLVIVS